MKASKAQIKALISLMKRDTSVENIRSSTLDVLHREGWYDLTRNIITESGMVAAGIPTQERDVMQLTKPYTYMGKVLPIGTNIMVLMMWEAQGRVMVEGHLSVGGKATRIVLYKPASAVFTKVVMPDLGAM